MSQRDPDPDGENAPPDVVIPPSEPSSRLSLPGRPSRVSRRHWLLGVFALVSLFILYSAHEIILPFILALVIAYVFTPAVVWLEKRRIPRWCGILGIYLSTLGSAYGFFAIAAPRMMAEGRAFAQELPKNIKKIEDEIIPEWEAKFRALGGGAPAPKGAPEPEPKPAIKITPQDDGSIDVDVGSGLMIHPLEDGGYRIDPTELGKKKGGLQRAVQYLERNYMDVVRGGVAFVANVARGVFLFFMTLMVAAYLMLTHEKIIGFFRGLVRPSARHDFDRLLRRIDLGLSGVVRGQLLICLVNGILTAIGFAIIGVKYWPVLALVAAIGSLIPIFGSIFSSVPAVAIGLTQSISIGFLVLGWIILIHQIEANYLNPKIIGTQAHLHPVMIVFVLLAGEHWFHAAGALLAVPCLSIARSLFLHFREVADRDEGWSSANTESGDEKIG
jgi:predicted PurR-regulated permease PerM